MNNIELLRRQKGLSVNKLAQLIGVSGSAVSQWEKGEKSPRRENLEKLSEVLEASVDEILGKEKSPTLEMDGTEELIWRQIRELTPNQKRHLLSYLAGLRANQEA